LLSAEVPEPFFLGAAAVVSGGWDGAEVGLGVCVGVDVGFGEGVEVGFGSGAGSFPPIETGVAAPKFVAGAIAATWLA
jgi:hypothetical protein